jgi:hypothetical protein
MKMFFLILLVVYNEILSYEHYYYEDKNAICDYLNNSISKLYKISQKKTRSKEIKDFYLIYCLFVTVS